MKRTVFLISALFLIAFYLNAQKPINVIFDTDMGNDIDDALALDMLYKYQEDNLINLLAITSNKTHPSSEEYIDIMNNFYGFPNIPIGRITEGANSDRKNCYTRDVVVDKSFKRSYKDHSKLMKSVDLMRKTLAQQEDTSVVIISVGFLTNLSLLIDSKPDKYSDLSGMDLIRKKVKIVYQMAGEFEKGEKEKEYNIRKDYPASVNFFAKWPTKVVLTPAEVGWKILYPGSSIENDFKFTKKNPLVMGYEAYIPMPYDRPTWDLTAALAAVEGVDKYFGISPAGHVIVTEDSYTYFVPCTNGLHYYMKVNDIQAEMIKNRFINLITRVPKIYR